MNIEALDGRLTAIIQLVTELRSEVRSMMAPRDETLMRSVPPPERYLDPVEELARQIFVRTGVWDTSIDHISQALFLQAGTHYSLTVGKGDARRSVEGLKQAVMARVEEMARVEAGAAA